MEARALIAADGSETLSGLDTPVPWWSFTKLVLAVRALRLVEQGLLSLDERPFDAPYTVAQLLRHEAGLPDYGGLKRYHEDVASGRAPWPVDRLLAAVKADTLLYPPGEGWAYSNVGYLKVAQLIAARANTSLAEALDQGVFKPAGLTTARLMSRPEDMAGVAMGGAPDYHPGWVYHGLVVGTVADAARLLRALVVGSLLEPRSFKAMLRRRALPQFRSDRDRDPAYGLGLMLSATDPLTHPLGHTGGGPGSGFAAYAKAGRVVALWSDAASGLDATTEAFAALD